MTKFLINRLISDNTNTSDTEVRKKYGVLGGVIGLVCNGILFLTKLIVGMAINSIAVVSDAFNNLSDMGSAVVSVAGAYLSSRRPDDDHPYGHGRAEYISALIIAILIMMVGFELFKGSAGEIIDPQPVSVNAVTVVLLIASVLVKIWMWSSNRYMGKKINSAILMAAARDSLNDVIATAVVVVSALISPYISFPLDGIMGVLVSCLIIYTGYGIARDTIDKLLGQNAGGKLQTEIEEALLENSIIMGMHGLMVHDYGSGRKIASVHAEIPDTMSLVEAHKLVDSIEHKILSELNVDIVIHIDPVPEGAVRQSRLSTLKNSGDYLTNTHLDDADD